MEPYVEVHKDFLRSQWPGKNEAWIMRQHMETFGDWLRKKCQGDENIGEQLYLLVRQPSWHVLTYKGYEINGNTFSQLAKIKGALTKIVVYAWMPRIQMGTDKHIMDA